MKQFTFTGIGVEPVFSSRKSLLHTRLLFIFITLFMTFQSLAGIETLPKKDSPEHYKFMDDHEAVWYDLINRNVFYGYTEEHLAQAKELKWPQFIQDLKSIGRPEQSGSYSNAYDRMVNFTLDEMFKNDRQNYLRSINAGIEEAYSLKDNNKLEAENQLNKAKINCQVLLQLEPDHSELVQLNKDLKSAFENIIGTSFEDLYTSEFHAKNVGKILFSKSPIIIGKEDPNQFGESFTANDHIYAVAYLKGKVNDLVKNYSYDENINYSIQFDGNQDHIKSKLSPADGEQSYYLIEIIPDPTLATHEVDAAGWAEKLSVLSPRPHTLQLWFWAGKNQHAASEKIRIDLSGMDTEKLKANAQLASKKASDNQANSMQLPEEYKATSERFSSPELSEAKLTAALKRELGSACSSIKKLIVLVDDGDWEIRRDDYNNIEGRIADGRIRAIYTGSDGWCYLLDWIGFYQDYQGGGKYSSTFKVSWDKNKVVKIKCDNAK